MDHIEYIYGLAKCWQEEINRLNCNQVKHKSSSKEADELFDKFVSDADLRKKTKRLFLDGHYARAVEEAYKYIDNLVKKRAGKFCRSASGTKLMQEAFSPNNPILKINDFATETDRDEQQGYMEMLAGCMMGIRNPRAHDGDLEDKEETALRLLGFADHLTFRIRSAEGKDSHST